MTKNFEPAVLKAHHIGTIAQEKITRPSFQVSFEHSTAASANLG